MSTLQITNVSNEHNCATSICGQISIKYDKQSGLTRKDIAIMKKFRRLARSMFLKRRERYEKDPPKFVKDLLTTLHNELQSKSTVYNGDVTTAIKFENLEKVANSCDTAKAENCAALETELSPESKYILRFLRDITVEQAIIKQNFLVKLKEHLAERTAKSKQKFELQNLVPEEIKAEDSNTNSKNENSATVEVVSPVQDVESHAVTEIPAEQTIIRGKLMAELKERLAKIKLENVSD